MTKLLAASNMWSQTRSRGAVRSSIRCSTLIQRQAPRERLPPIDCFGISKPRGLPRMDPRYHPHADHFSAAGYLKDVTGAPTAIGERVVEVQRIWKKLYNLPDTFRTDGSQWDHLFADGERFTLVQWRQACCYPLVTLCAPSPT